MVGVDTSVQTHPLEYNAAAEMGIDSEETDRVVQVYAIVITYIELLDSFRH